jgi:aromatic ring-opening dioxygenase catalytic subunit (LigB family)
MRQPTLFLPHGGGPCFFLNENGPVPEMWRPMGDFLARVVADLPERPKAMLVVSGHWEEPRLTVHTGEKPGLLYDYGGFPEHTYHLKWDAPGAPDVARRAAVLLEGAGFATGEEQAAADAFDAALTEAVTDPDPARRDARLTDWETMPFARIAHPPRQEEHLLPLMVAAGAGGADPGQHIFRDRVIGWTVSGYRFG